MYDKYVLDITFLQEETSLSQKLSLIIFSVSLLIGVSLRSFMLLFTIEYDSGFIKSQYTALAVFMIVLLLITAALVFFASYYQKKLFTKLKIPHNIIFGVTEALMAVAIIYEAFFSPLLSYITGVQLTLHKLTSLLSAAALIYMCVCRFKKLEYPKIITIIPLFFWITRVITVFTEFATLATVSDTILETASMCLALVVFLNYSKQSCGIELKNLRLSRAITNLCAYFCAISSVPRFICAVINPNAFGYFGNIPALTTFAAALFATAIILKD